VDADTTSPAATSEDPNAATARLLGQATEQLIGWLIPIIGLGAAAIVVVYHHRDWATGIAAGSALAWLNFRWLAQGLDALVVDSTAQIGSQKPQVSIVTYFLAAFRYALIALCVYGIFKFLSIPLVSLLLGLCSLGAATIAASIYEIAKPLKSRP
jgi:uncharacterized membrane protein YvlD (DUF360 family)